MPSTPDIRPFTSHEWRAYRDLRLQALADAPDAFGSTLALEEAQSDAWWEDRLEAASDPRWNLPLLAEMSSGPCGLAWGRIEPASPERADLYQMWVHPDARRLGTGRRLVDAVVAWATRAGARYLALGVTCGDAPANRLYVRAGFQQVGDPKPLRPGSRVMAHTMHLPL